MKEETEIGWLKLTDKSVLVLTTRYIFQEQDSGLFGESRAIIPRRAVTSVRLSWERSRGALVFGLFLVTAALLLLLADYFGAPAGISRVREILNLSPSTVSIIQYALLISGIGLFALFWFYKRYELQILAAGASVGGTPTSFQEAESFCSLLLSRQREPQPAVKKPEPPVDNPPSPAEADWRL